MVQPDTGIAVHLYQVLLVIGPSLYILDAVPIRQEFCFSTKGPPLMPAGVDTLTHVAEYVRMSTDHQRYSTQNQSDVIRDYAARHQMVVMRTFADDGKSGLNIGGRSALQALIKEVDSGRCPFKAILVYDVSRWGRFQDVDESAHYEYLCTRAGIRIIYCAEQFSNDGTPVASIIKSVKRAMAGEYSRELSTKVFAGQCKLVELGFHQGGPAGYGLRRQLLEDGKTPKGELGFGQHKSIQTDRVVLVPGPDVEVETVRRIYRNFVHDRLTEKAIANALNSENILTDLGRAWTRGTVHQILVNEKYIGNNVYNRTSFKLKKDRVKNPAESWIRRDGAYEALISRPLYDAARAVIMQRSNRFSDAELLDLLRELLARAGTLSGLVIDEQDNLPSSAAYAQRFGGLLRAYALVGFTPARDYDYLETNRALRAWKPSVVDTIVGGLCRVGAAVSRNPTSELLTINEQWTVSVVIARCQLSEAGTARWRIRFDTGLGPDITLAVRMDRDNRNEQDYYIVPTIDLGIWPQRIGEENGVLIDGYRFETLDILYDLAERKFWKEAA